MTNDNESLLGLRDAVLMGNYARPPVALVRGSGCRVWDADGRDYLDLIAGIAVSALGHAHPAVVDAVRRQAAELAHTSNLFLNEPAVRLAERLVGLLGPAGATARVFFCNSGTEANETALKIARRHGRDLDPSGNRLEVVAAEGAFHGRTLGALSLTWAAAKREPFEPLPAGVRFVPHGDSEALRDAVTPRTSAVFLEPVLGESGVIPPPDGYLRAAREVCDSTGALLVLDEVQSGIGRTGEWFGHEHDGVLPDVVTLAKGLGGGLPIGACIGLGDAATALRPGDHGSTFGGNPVACAAALAVIDTIERDGLLDNAQMVGKHLADGIAALVPTTPLLTGVRGRGLWLALTLDTTASGDVETAAREAGFLVNAVAPDAIRLAPPLVLDAHEADTFITALPEILDRAAERAGVTVRGRTAPDEKRAT
jgi:acetylornithine/N-succinyldiaminopimelate aminotransferase